MFGAVEYHSQWRYDFVGSQLCGCGCQSGGL